MRSFSATLFAALAASSKAVADFDGITLEADPVQIPADPGRPLRLTALRGDYVIHAGDQPVQIDENGSTTFIDLEGRPCSLELWVESRMRPIDLPSSPRLVFETYQCSLSNGTVELGWCFKPAGGDDCLGFDLVVGSFDPKTLTQQSADAAWKQAMWAAAAIAGAYLPAGETERSNSVDRGAPASADEDRDLDEMQRVIICDAALSPDQLDDKYNADGDGQHPLYPREQWRDAVVGEDTLTGYWQWVADRLNDDVTSPGIPFDDTDVASAAAGASEENHG